MLPGEKSLNNFRRFITNQLQRFHRRLNPAYLEQIYQSSYFNSIANTDWIDDTPIASPNGGTASFSLLYIILSILKDQKTTSLLELGAGKSSSLLLQYAKHFNTSLTIIDDDDFWLKTVTAGFSDVNSVHAPLTTCTSNSKSIQWYNCKAPTKPVDFILVDGPMAYKKDIRYNRLGILNWLPDILEKEFIIVIDDTNRVGEYELVRSIYTKLTNLGIKIGQRHIIGGNSQTILATDEYRKFLYL